MVIERAGVAQVQLQGPGVAGLPQALDGSGVTKKVGVEPLPQAGVGGRGADDLPGPLPAHREEAVGRAQAPVEGIGLEAVAESGGAGHQPGLAALADDLQGARLPAEMPHRQAQGLGDPEAGLEKHQDEEGVPIPLPPPAGGAQLLDLVGGEVRHYLQGPGR